MEINEKTIFGGVIGCIFIEFLWESYLNLRQHRVQVKCKDIPGELIGIMSRETFDKARLYAIDRGTYGMVREAFEMVINLLLSSYGLYWLWEVSGNFMEYFGFEPTEKNEMLHSAVCMSLLNTVNSIVEIPLSVYYTFYLEEKHGFNKQTVSFFIKDKIKAYILQLVLLIPLSCGIVYIVKIGGEYFFMYLWLFIVLVSLFIYAIYPDFIAPLFDKYIHLPPGELRSEIEDFAKSLEFPLSDLYVVAGSKRSAHSNAYFYGFFKKKRIVLFDTLLKDFDMSLLEDKKPEAQEDEEEKKKKLEEKGKKGCDNLEVLAVLGHEMGHWKLNHNLKTIIVTELNLLLVFIIFAKLFRYDVLYRAFGFYNSTPVLIGFTIILQYVFIPYFALVRFLMAMMSRRFEFQADRFVKTLGRAHYLKKSLIKLNVDNLDFPIYDRWYSKWYNSHPPLLERLQALDKDE